MDDRHEQWPSACPACERERELAPARVEATRAGVAHAVPTGPRNDKAPATQSFATGNRYSPNGEGRQSPSSGQELASRLVGEDYLSPVTNACHASLVTVSVNPWRSVVSRTRTPLPWPTSTQALPPPLLKLLLRH